MKKIFVNYGGVVLFYLVILLCLCLLNTSMNNNKFPNNFSHLASQK